MITPISYNGGTIWVDETKSVNKGYRYWVSGESGRGAVVNGETNSQYSWGNPIIGQSNLKDPIPNVPYVEIEEDVEKLAWEWCDDHREVGAFKAGYKAALAKKYTEEDMRKLYLGVLQNVGTTTKQSDMPTWEQVLQSLQPKIKSIEIEMEGVKEFMSEETLQKPFDKNRAEQLWDKYKPYKNPVTYQKDGKTFLKVKSVQYMCEVEQNKCNFCNEIKSVERTYLRPSKYSKSINSEEYLKLHNEGDYFIIIYTCKDCGVPKTEEMDLLKFIIENKFYLYKDETWYSTLQKFNKLNNGIPEKVFYKSEQLIDLINKENEK